MICLWNGLQIINIALVRMLAFKRKKKHSEKRQQETKTIVTLCVSVIHFHSELVSEKT